MYVNSVIMINEVIYLPLVVEMVVAVGEEVERHELTGHPSEVLQASIGRPEFTRINKETQHNIDTRRLTLLPCLSTGPASS